MKVAVFDVETTGFGNHDRIVEIGIVTLDMRTGKVVDQFDTLIDPDRDTGPARVHGITNEMVADAPYFESIAGEIRKRLHNRVLAAHNLPFDRRMIELEYARLGVGFDAGTGICTYQLSKMKLAEACATYGVHLDRHHNALSDAQATANLLLKLTSSVRGQPAKIGQVR